MEMNLRVLKYFLAVVETGSITGAAKKLHISQPALSKQLRDFEAELGTRLIIRGSRRITLTEEGMILCRRAQEIFLLIEKTEEELSAEGDELTGSIAIGAGETEGFRILAKAAASIRERYPNVHYTINSGDTVEVLEQLEHGLLDFGVIVDVADSEKYNILKLPHKDVWGVLLRADDPLAEKRFLTPDDLVNVPLLISRQALKGHAFADWFGAQYEQVHFVGVYNLVFNASIMAAESVGYVLCLKGIINTQNSELVFRPLSPSKEVTMNLIWKKDQILSRPARKFLEALQSYYRRDHCSRINGDTKR